VRVAVRVTRATDHGATLVVDLQLRPGWHVNAERPLQDYLMPTAVRLAARERGWRVEEAVYPAPRTVWLGFQDEPLAVYEGTVRIEAVLQRTTSDGDAPPFRWLPVEVRLQACSDQVCLAPETLTLNVSLAGGQEAEIRASELANSPRPRSARR
jgi:DsbC/DsbD-like thiol-disulfide interchange protein